MKLLRIDVEDGRRWFLPGETVSGRAVWRLEEPPKNVDLRLFWFTSGKGTQDVEVVGEVGSDAASSAGEMSFSFELPLAPYSFSGSLITLSWALELVIQPGGHTERIDLVVAPTAVEVRIESLDRKPFPQEAVGFTMLPS
jgi:hypothetical protein